MRQIKQLFSWEIRTIPLAKVDPQKLLMRRSDCFIVKDINGSGCVYNVYICMYIYVYIFIMSTKDRLTNAEIKKEWTDLDGTNRIQTEAEEADDPQQ